jgi:hypothetical protein
VRLTGALAHLTALAAQATHALLAPLGPHASSHVELKHEGVSLAYASGAERGGTAQLGASAGEALHGRGDELRVLHHCHDRLLGKEIKHKHMRSSCHKRSTELSLVAIDF